MQSNIYENHARAVWGLFHEKYSDLVSGVSKTHPALCKALSTAFLSNTYDEKSVILIQRQWRMLSSKDTLRSVNPCGLYHGDFKHLVNNQKIKRSLNVTKQNILLAAIQVGNWDSSIFQDKYILEIAMSLFAKKKITQQQIYSILERHQTLKYYKYEKTYLILDDSKQFTIAAKSRLFISMICPNYFKPLSDLQIETFRMLILTLPVSERVFYISDYKEVYGSFISRLSFLDASSRLSGGLLHLSAGARDALGLARFGNKEYVRAMPRLGRLTIDDIEHGVLRKARYASTWYTGLAPYGESLHGWNGIDLDSVSAFAHDNYHANVMSVIPSLLLEAQLRFVALSRQVIGFLWTKEIWEWVDCNYNAFFRLHKHLDLDNISTERMTELFCEMLYAQSEITKYDNDHAPLGNGSFLFETSRKHNYCVTLHGVMIYLDMIENASEWLKLGISPEFFTEPMSLHFKLLKDFYIHIQLDDKRCQVVKSFIFMRLMHKKESLNLIYAFIDLIDENQHRFTFIKRQDHIDKANQVALALDGEMWSLDVHDFITNASGYSDSIEIDYFYSLILEGYKPSKARALVEINFASRKVCEAIVSIPEFLMGIPGMIERACTPSHPLRSSDTPTSFNLRSTDSPMFFTMPVRSSDTPTTIYGLFEGANSLRNTPSLPDFFQYTKPT